MTRTALLVLGMHRSGTSAVTGLLVHLGAAAPCTLLPPAHDNPLGFWESAPFCELHDRLLRAAGSEWDLWSHVDLDALPDNVLAQFAREFHSLLDGEFGATPLFAVKDPRMCRLMPFWLHRLSEAGIAARVVLVTRDPLEVAHSLATRDGVGIEHALLVWLRHMLDVEAATRQTVRQVVRYSDLLANWRATATQLAERLTLTWPREPEPSEIDDFIRPSLRHHVISFEPSSVRSNIASWVTRAYCGLEMLLKDEATSTLEAFAILDEVRAEFDRDSRPFATVLSAERVKQRAAGASLAEELRWLRQHVAQLEGCRTRLQQELAEEQERFRKHAAWSDGERDKLVDYKALLERRVTELEREVAQASERSATAIGHLSARAANAERHVQALRESMSWRCTAPLRAIAAAWMSRRTHESE